MTPQEAQELLACVAGQPAACLQDHMDWKDAARALETLAGLRAEYTLQYRFCDEWEELRYRRDTAEEAELLRSLYPQYETRVAARHVTEWEVAE